MMLLLVPLFTIRVFPKVLMVPTREDKDWGLGDLKKSGEDNVQWDAVETIEKGQVLVID